MQVVATSAAQLEQLQEQGAQLEAYMRGPASRAVLRRYVAWRELAKLPNAGALFDVPANDEADRAAVAFAQVVKGLDAGTLELAAWQSETAPVLGVVRAGAVREGLGWFMVPLIVVGAAAAAAGVWVLVDAYLSVRQLEARSDDIRARAQAQATDAIARIGVNDPAGAKMVADALERANRAAANVQPGLLDQLASGIAAVGEGIRDSSSMLLVMLGLWLWSRTRGTT